VSKMSGRDIREIISRLAQIYYHTKGGKEKCNAGKGAFRKMFGKEKGSIQHVRRGIGEA